MDVVDYQVTSTTLHYDDSEADYEDNNADYEHLVYSPFFFFSFFWNSSRLMQAHKYLLVALLQIKGLYMCAVNKSSSRGGQNIRIRLLAGA